MKTLLLTTAFAVAATGAFAGTINLDFETGFAQDLHLGTGPVDLGQGVMATSSENMQLVKTGRPRDAFVPDDMPEDTSFGDYFLTGDFQGNTDLKLSFGTDVRGLSFDIADIDGGGQYNTEMFDFIAFLDGEEVAKIEFNSGDNDTGDAVITEVVFGDDVRLDALHITGVTKGGTRNIGWGLDNLHATAVPLPAAGWLLIGAFGGLAAMKRRRKTV